MKIAVTMQQQTFFMGGYGLSVGQKAVNLHDVHSVGGLQKHQGCRLLREPVEKNFQSPFFSLGMLWSYRTLMQHVKVVRGK